MATRKKSVIEAMSDKIHTIPLESLHPFSDHLFKPYSDQRLDALVESIKNNGMFNPIIVRPIKDEDNNEFEILSGHNRVEASKRAGKQDIPAKILKGLNDEEAKLIVIETNLFQRSITDMSHSELALALSTHYDATKKQGRRSDLINEIEEMLKDDGEKNNSDTSGAVRQKTDNRTQVGVVYGMSSRNFSYYLRINKLIEPLKNRLDSDEIAKRTAVELSYLNDTEQEIVDKTLTKLNRSLMWEESKALRSESNIGTLTEERTEEILAGHNHMATLTLKLSRQLEVLRKPEQSLSDFEDEIALAIAFYREHGKPAKSNNVLP